MEAQTPPPAAEPSPPPPPPPPGETEEKAGGGIRFGAVVLALVLGFAAAVMLAVSVEIGDTAPCDDPAAVQASGKFDDEGNLQCFDGSSGQKTASLVLTWPGGVVGVVAALAALAFAIRGRGGALVARLTAAAVALSGLGILVGSI